MDKKNIVALAVATARANRNTPVAYSFGNKNYSYDEMQDTLRNEFKALAPTAQAYLKNKYTIFSIISETVDEILPERLKRNYSAFAETRFFAQGDKPEFKINKASFSRTRAKQFITRVGLSGRYEVFKLAPGITERFEVPTSAIGGAAQIGFEEFLDGRVDFSELVDIVLEGMDDLIFEEIGKALEGAMAQLPVKQRVAVNGFDEKKFDSLVSRMKSYGPVTVYCTDEFANKMIPQEAWRYTDRMKEELFRTGRVQDYKDLNIVILPNQYKDPMFGEEKMIDPSNVYVVANGFDTKPIKIAVEGNTLTKDSENDDWSRDIQVYKKVGVVCMMTNNIGVYKDTSLSKNGEFVLKDTVKNVITTIAG